jgi:Xaa-Pro aminopeptidase
MKNLKVDQNMRYREILADTVSRNRSRSEFSGIGVRIEDDVLITSGEGGRLGCLVLTDGCPKTVQELESLAAP